MHHPWSDSDAKLLKGLRESAGLSQDTLAKRLVLSLAQVRELEGEDQGRFYSEQIKAHAGHRLLARLGHVPLNPVATDPPAPVAAAGPRGGAAPARSRVDWADSKVRPPASLHSREAPTWRWLGLLLAAAGLVLGALSQWPRALAPEAVAPPVSAPASPAAPATVTVAAAAPSPVPAEPVAEPATAALAPATSASSMSCSFGPAAIAATYQSPEAKRPSTYVYVESRGAVQVCIRDAQGRESAFELGSGGSRNVPGAPPYTVQLSDWSQARVFFEGRQVRLAGLGQGGTALLKPFQAP